MKKTNKYLPYIAILFISIIFFYPVWLQGKLPLPADALVGAHLPWLELEWEDYPAGVPIKNQEITDSISQFYPWRSYVAEYWRAGKPAALWNPYMFNGVPFLASLHSASLYPLNFLYLLFSDSMVWTLLVFSQIFFAALFMYLFLRELKLTKFACMFGAVTFTFSGYMVAWLEFVTGGQAGMWLPLLLFLVIKYFRLKSEKFLLCIPLVFFFIYTAGDFQVPLYISVIYVLFTLYISFPKLELNKQYVKTFLKYQTMMLFGVLLSASQLLPTIELYQNSIRIDDPYISHYFYGLMDWQKITNFLWPDFFGNVVTRNYWSRFGYHEYLGFTGILSLVFLGYSFFKKKTSEEKFFWIVLFVSFLILFPTPLGLLPYQIGIPGLSSSSASRILFIIGFSISVLGSYGFSKWQKSKPLDIARATVYLISITAGVAVGVSSAIYYMRQSPYASEVPLIANLMISIRNMIPSSLILLAFLFLILFFAYVPVKRLKNNSKFLSVLVILLVVLEMLRFSWKNTPFSPKEFLYPTTPTIDYLLKQDEPFRIAGPGIPLNYFMQYRISSVDGYDSLYPAQNALWYSMMNNNNIKFPPGRYGEVQRFESPLLNYANLEFIIDYKKNPSNRIPGEEGVYLEGLINDRYELVFEEKRVGIFKNKNVLPKVWLTNNYEVLSDPENLVVTLTNLEDSEKKVWLEHSPVLEYDESQDLEYEILDFKQEFNEITFTIDSNQESLLFLSESYNPGWKAVINGQPVEIYRANFIFQSIIVPSGKSDVKFVYYPNSYKYGRNISLSMLIVLMVYLFINRNRILFSINKQ